MSKPVQHLDKGGAADVGQLVQLGAKIYAKSNIWASKKHYAGLTKSADGHLELLPTNKQIFKNQSLMMEGVAALFCFP